MIPAQDRVGLFAFSKVQKQVMVIRMAEKSPGFED